MKEVVTFQVLFPVIIHCCSYGEIPILGTEVCHSPLHHPTSLGWAAVASVWFSAVVVLISYCICNRAIKTRCSNRQNFFFSPAKCNQRLPTMRGCWSKLQYSAYLHSPVMWLEQLRGTWGLDKSHSSDCKQMCPW